MTKSLSCLASVHVRQRPRLTLSSAKNYSFHVERELDERRLKTRNKPGTLQYKPFQVV